MFIVKISEDGIYYQNEAKENLFLSFKVCNENWLAYRKRTELLTDEQVEEFRLKDKIIGQRNRDEKSALIEFFAKPFVRFEFQFPEQEETFNTLRDTIYNYGWIIYDLT